MAEITKITSPMIPKENLGSSRPVTEQAFHLHHPGKVHKPEQDRDVRDREAGGQALRETLGRTAVVPLLRGTNDVIQQIQKTVAMLQMGIATSDIVATDPMRELLNSLFVPPERLLELLLQQAQTGILFRGEAFDVLRDILGKFPDNPAVRDAVVHLLKVFEYNVNLDYSVKAILYQCENLLDYMFSGDRAQFGEYLDQLADMLMPDHSPTANALANAGLMDKEGNLLLPNPETPDLHPVTGNPLTEEELALLEQLRRDPGLSAYSDNRLGVEPAEAAKVLKNNLLPLLGEVVVKYHQSEGIRDLVMVVVHNIVRVDKGTPQALEEGVSRLIDTLSRVANVGEHFESNLHESLVRDANRAKFAENQVFGKLATVVSQTLHNPDASPAALRQAESLLLSLLQNQSSMMNVLHFILPMDTPNGRVYSEMYVDPDSNERPKGGGGEGRARKIFLSVESESIGSMEMQFLESGRRVEFSMWCSEGLVEPLRRTKRSLADLMLVHGYTLTGVEVDELVSHHSIVQVFPKLLDRKVGIDVRI